MVNMVEHVERLRVATQLLNLSTPQPLNSSTISTPPPLTNLLSATKF
jgi:hypothetical protein